MHVVDTANAAEDQRSVAEPAQPESLTCHVGVMEDLDDSDSDGEEIACMRIGSDSEDSMGLGSGP